MTSSQPQTLIIGLSGPSSSGKTTLARLLRGVFNIEASPDTNGNAVKLFILHEDDFYKRDVDIPERTVSSVEHGTRKIQDWDCIEALNLPALDRTIRHVKQHGTPPPDMRSKEDQNSVGDVGVSDSEVATLKAEVVEWLKAHGAGGSSTTTTTTASGGESGGNGGSKQVTICILDGFLLFGPPPELLSSSSSSSSDHQSTAAESDPISPTSIPLLKLLHSTLHDTLDLRVFLPSTRQKTLARRANRSGYVTMEGFWQDPPGFVEDVVWPNYARDHAWMFRNMEDVDRGKVDRDGPLVKAEGIVVGPGNGDVSMREVFPWGVGVVKDAVGRVLG